MKILEKAALFCLGGGGYVTMELLYRGFSHSSMFAAGGTCFLLLGALERKRLPLLLRAAAGSAVITAVELSTGLLVNRQYQVWDYRDQPGNLLGQICPVFSLLWAPLSLAAMALYPLAEGQIQAVLGKRLKKNDKSSQITS